MLSDALISFGVVLAGIFIYFYEVYYVDSVLTIVFSVYIIYISYPLLTKSFKSLMDINISNLTSDQIKEVILVDEVVLDYKDLHISKPSSSFMFISLSIILKDENMSLKKVDELKVKITQGLKSLGFNHIVIQSDSKESSFALESCVLK